jgi:hypothetical protein
VRSAVNRITDSDKLISALASQGSLPNFRRSTDAMRPGPAISAVLVHMRLGIFSAAVQAQAVFPATAKVP